MLAAGFCRQSFTTRVRANDGFQDILPHEARPSRRDCPTVPGWLMWLLFFPPATWLNGLVVCHWVTGEPKASGQSEMNFKSCCFF